MATTKKRATSSIKDFKRHTESGRKRVGRPKGSKTARPVSDFVEFASEDLIKIINTCKKNEVGSFSYGGLKIGFGKELSQTGDIPIGSMNALNEVVGPVYTEAEIEAQASVEHDQSVSMTEDELAELQITNPVRAQEIMMGVGDA